MSRTLTKFSAAQNGVGQYPVVASKPCHVAGADGAEHGIAAQPLHLVETQQRRPPALKKNTSAPPRPQSTMKTLYNACIACIAGACLVAQVAAVPVR